MIVQLEKIATQELEKKPQIEATVPNPSTRKYNTRWKHRARNTKLPAREISFGLSRNRKRVSEDSFGIFLSMFVKDTEVLIQGKK